MRKALSLERSWTAVMALAVVCWSGCCSGANAAAPFFMGLGDLPGGSFSSSASGVSADGSVVVGTGRSGSGGEAFRWTKANGMVGLGDLPGGDFYSSAFDVSANGSVVVGYSMITPVFGPIHPITRLRAFRSVPGDSMVSLGTLPPGDAGSSGAYGVSADGSVVVGSSAGSPGGAFRWTPDTGMETIPGDSAYGVSADGTVIVGLSSSVSGNEAFRWTQVSGVVGLGDLPDGGFNSIAYGVSADGSVIVGQGSSAAGAEAFRWRQGSGMIGLGILPGFVLSLAQDVSADGSVVIGSGGSASGNEAFLWDASHGMRSLRDVLVNEFGLGASLSGWTLTSANDISADGQYIVGSGTNPSGDSEAWIARLRPTVPGDVNFDGAVDVFDVNTVSAFWGTSGPQGDANGDGAVDIFDVNLISANWTAAGGGGALTAVPEPTTVVLAGICVAASAAVGFCRRRGLGRRRWPGESIVDRA